MTDQRFSFLHFDPNGTLRAFLQRWFPTDRLSWATPDPYRSAAALRPRPPALNLPRWGQWSNFEGPLILSDPLVSLPQMPWRELPPQWMLNSLWIPTGASRTAIGLFLCQEHIQPGTPVEFCVYPQGGEDDQDPWTLKLLVLGQLPFAPLAGDEEDQQKYTYLTILVDRRYIDRVQIVSFPAATDWNSLIACLPAASLIEGYQPPSVPPEPWLWNRDLPAGLALDAIAACAGQRVVYDPAADRYRLQSIDNALFAFQDNRLWVEQIGPIARFAFDVPMRVGQVDVSFPKALQIREDQRTLLPSGQREVRSYALPAPNGPMAVTAWCSLPVVYDLQGQGINNQQVQDALAAIANYYQGWQNYAYQYHYSLPLIARWDLTGLDDYIWIQWEQRGRQYCPKMLLSSLPPGCWPVEWPFGCEQPSSSSSSPSSSSSESSSSSSSSSSSAGGGCGGASAQIIVALTPIRTGDYLQFQRRRLTFVDGCLTEIATESTVSVYICCTGSSESSASPSSSSSAAPPASSSVSPSSSSAAPPPSSSSSEESSSESSESSQECYGQYCRWRWNGSWWEIINPCPSFCNCPYPTRDGEYEGEELEMECQP